MPLAKQYSAHLEKAQRRLSAIRSINSNLDLGKGLSIQAYSSLIERTRNRIDAYNATLSLLSADRIAVEEAEKELKELNERMLLAIALEFGKDSPEYELAGGIRKSKRKRPARKKEEQAALN